MARVRNHAAEYAALKARADAVGLSTRAYRRARKAEPQKYYSPRAQKTLQRRATELATRNAAIAALAAANAIRAPSSYSAEELYRSAQRHYDEAPKEGQIRWNERYQEYQIRYKDNWEPFWEDYDAEDSDIDELLYYHD